MSKHTPGPWHFVPWHIEEGQPAVRCAEGWIVATASTDADAEFIARAPAMPARIAELEAENKQLGDAYERNTNAAMQLHARAERAEAELAALRALAELGRWCLTESRDNDCGDIGGGSLQDKAIELGLLAYVTVAEPCGEACACMDYYAGDEWPHDCLRETERAALKGEP